MAVRPLTADQHRQVLSQLLDLGRTFGKSPVRSADIEYTSLMVCFLLHEISAANSLLRLREAFGEAWFPTTVGYIVARSMFETDVTAHYIGQEPSHRAHQYIAFESVLKKHEMDTCAKHRGSKDPQWRDAMCLLWRKRWAQEEQEVNAQYDQMRHQFETRGKGGKVTSFHNWSGKSIRQMAVEVEHEEAYDVFYADLSSFTHADVRLANRFLRLHADGMTWSQRAREFDVGSVFRYAAIFLTCHLKLFGQQFGVWDAQTVERCWNSEES